MTIAKEGSFSIEMTDALTYDTLSPALGKQARRAAKTVNQHAQVTSEDVLLIGWELCNIKRLLGRGVFGRWMRKEVRFCEKTGRRYRRVHESLREFADTVSVLSPSELYRLSGIPARDIGEIVDKMRNGHTFDLSWFTGIERKNSPKKRLSKPSQNGCGQLTVESPKGGAATLHGLAGPIEVETAAVGELAQRIFDRVPELAARIAGLNVAEGAELIARPKKHEESRAEFASAALVQLMSVGVKIHAFQGVSPLALR